MFKLFFFFLLLKQLGVILSLNIHLYSYCRLRILIFSVFFLFSFSNLKSFWLEKATGKKCIMLSALDLSVTYEDDDSIDPEYWKWYPVPESRYIFILFSRLRMNLVVMT